MITPKYFVELMMNYGIDFYAGVPDSLLKDICAYFTDNFDENHHVITANEGGAVGIAAGHHLASRNIPLVYMQNSGQGNIINPLVSLTDKDVYNIPILFLIGWRGKPGEKDEPQHLKQGKITLPILDAVGTKYQIMSKDESTFSEQLKNAVAYMRETKESFAFIVEKETFVNYTLQNRNTKKLSLSREEAIRAVAETLEKRDVIVSTTGMISRELFEYRKAKGESNEQDFLTVGSMGHASQIALGIALEITDKRIYCFDGDGACLMHMGSMAIIAGKSPKNYVHIVFNNGAHDSVGGQQTVGFQIKLKTIAKAMGYKNAFSVNNKSKLLSTLIQIKNTEGPIFIEIRVKKGNRINLGRPTSSPIENKISFMNFLKKSL